MPSETARPGDGEARLRRCIRDLAALHALPSMCVGRPPDEALAIVLDALPTVLSCELVLLSTPNPARTHGALGGRRLSEAEVAKVSRALAADADAEGARAIPGAGRLWCIDAEVPIGALEGRLVVGRNAPPDEETDRVLVRSAANLVGTTLEAANLLDVARRKDEFLAVLGHELRNPLAPIMTAVELLHRHPAAARERQVIDRNARHMARLVDDLLDISRVTRGHVELRSEPVSLASVLERAAEIASALISRSRHTLRVGPSHGVVVQGDPVRLAQVFGNLLTNAAKFTPPGGLLQITTDTTPGRVRVTVRDNGRGIPPASLRRIFEPFVQADEKNDALRGGLGLGLAIVANLVERHGGTIVAHSDGLGRGASFTVDLPSVAVQEARSEPTVPTPPNSGRGYVRVLIVDDNADVAELLAEALEVEGFQTAIAYDAHEAMERWTSFAPHAAVLDLAMPDVDGYQLAQMVRRAHGEEPMLIASTGYAERKDRLLSANSGFDSYFVKPISVQELVRLLDERMRVHQASA